MFGFLQNKIFDDDIIPHKYSFVNPFFEFFCDFFKMSSDARFCLQKKVLNLEKHLFHIYIIYLYNMQYGGFFE